MQYLWVKEWKDLGLPTTFFFFKKLNVLELFNKNTNNFVKIIKTRIFFIAIRFGGETIVFDYEPVITT